MEGWWSERGPSVPKTGGMRFLTILVNVCVCACVNVCSAWQCLGLYRSARHWARSRDTEEGERGGSAARRLIDSDCLRVCVPVHLLLCVSVAHLPMQGTPPQPTPRHAKLCYGTARRGAARRGTHALSRPLAQPRHTRRTRQAHTCHGWQRRHRVRRRQASRAVQMLPTCPFLLRRGWRLGCMHRVKAGRALPQDLPMLPVRPSTARARFSITVRAP